LPLYRNLWYVRAVNCASDREEFFDQTGTEDEWIPIERGRELAAMIPNCEFTEIPGSGHLMQEDAPEAIVSAALRLLR